MVDQSLFTETDSTSLLHEPQPNRSVVPHLELDALLRILKRMKTVIDADDPRETEAAAARAAGSAGANGSGAVAGDASAGAGESKEDGAA